MKKWVSYLLGSIIYSINSYDLVFKYLYLNSFSPLGDDIEGDIKVPLLTVSRLFVYIIEHINVVF